MINNYLTLTIIMTPQEYWHPRKQATVLIEKPKWQKPERNLTVVCAKCQHNEIKVFLSEQSKYANWKCGQCNEMELMWDCIVDGHDKYHSSCKNCRIIKEIDYVIAKIKLFVESSAHDYNCPQSAFIYNDDFHGTRQCDYCLMRLTLKYRWGPCARMPYYSAYVLEYKNDIGFICCKNCYLNRDEIVEKIDIQTITNAICTNLQLCQQLIREIQTNYTVETADKIQSMISMLLSLKQEDVRKISAVLGIEIDSTDI